MKFIEEKSEAFGCSKSAVVRAALDEYMDRIEKKENAMLYGIKPLKTIAVKPKDKRGYHQKRIGEKNKRRIVAWRLKNPGRRQSDCAKALGISTNTVYRCLYKIRMGII